MRSVVMDQLAGPLQVREVADPAPPPGGVVVDVHATGLCRSDWHAWAGHDDVALPHVPGHELAGVVSDIGDGVERWRVGDRVTVPFVCGCGRCAWCAAGQAQVCPDQEQPGFTHWGSFAERVALHAADTNLVAIPEGVTTEAAASLGCRFATAYRALTARAGVQRGEWVCVVGAGGVGLSAVMVASALGAQVVADRDGADDSPVVLDKHGGGACCLHPRHRLEKVAHEEPAGPAQAGGSAVDGAGEAGSGDGLDPGGVAVHRGGGEDRAGQWVLAAGF